MSNKVKATLAISIHVDCPECGEFLNILDDSDTCNVDHNEESFILEQVFPDNECWVTAHDTVEVDDVECTYCHHIFSIEGVNWV